MTPQSTPRAPEVSVVIPFYNEAEAAPGLVAEVVGVLETQGYLYELVLVNDGSKDTTGAALNTLAARHACCRVFHLEKNSGQAAALLFGFAQARGPILVTLDGDGQNCPADIPALIKALHGADMVVGIRQQRHDSALRRGMSRLANGIRGRFLKDGMRDSGCALKAFRREICAAFLPIRSLYSFMPALAVIAGYRVIQLPVQHRERTTGQSKYGFFTFAWRPACDMLMIWWYAQRRCPPVRATSSDKEA